MRPLDGRNVALGVSGSIACYKAVDLASKLVQLGAEVDVMMTPAAREFVAPLTFAAITHRPVAESLFDPRSELLIDHVAIAERADVVIIAPSTAQTIAKLAMGLADDPIGATVLATAAPVIVAPAMDANMYESPATQANVDTLASRGVTIAGPAEGRMASGLTSCPEAKWGNSASARRTKKFELAERRSVRWGLCKLRTRSLSWPSISRVPSADL